MQEMDFWDKTPNIIVDRRPLWVVILDRVRRPLVLGLVFGLFFLLLGQEGPADLSPEGYKVLCVFFLCVSLWSTNVIPLSITSLLAIATIPLLGIMEAKEVYSFFGNKAVFFILGAFILSAAMIGCGFSIRLSMWVMETFGQSPGRLVTSIYAFAAVSSCFMSEHAVAAMLFPLTLEIVNSLGLDKKDSRFAKALFFAMAWGCIIGGTATVLGGGRVPLAVEILETATDGKSSIGFLEYSWLALPLVLLLLASGGLVLRLLFPPDIADIGPAHEVLMKKHQALGKMSGQEKGIALVMGLTLYLWFVHSDTLGIANIALMAIVALFVLKLVNWSMVENHINWAIILMYGGAICLGEVMAESGAALWLAKHIFEGAIESASVFLLAIAVCSTLLTTFMSNSAVIAILLPPAISLCPAYGISPALAAMTVVLPSNFAFILPIATPASALAYSSRYISLGEMIRAGSLLALFGMAGYLFLLLVFWPLVGFN